MKKLIKICFYIQMALLAIGVIQPINRTAILPIHVFYILLATVLGIVILVAAVRMKATNIPFSTFDLVVVVLNLLVVTPIIPAILFFIMAM